MTMPIWVNTRLIFQGLSAMAWQIGAGLCVSLLPMSAAQAGFPDWVGQCGEGDEPAPIFNSTPVMQTRSGAPTILLASAASQISTNSTLFEVRSPDQLVNEVFGGVARAGHINAMAAGDAEDGRYFGLIRHLYRGFSRLDGQEAWVSEIISGCAARNLGPKTDPMYNWKILSCFASSVHASVATLRTQQGGFFTQEDGRTYCSFTANLFLSILNEYERQQSRPNPQGGLYQSNNFRIAPQAYVAPVDACTMHIYNRFRAYIPVQSPGASGSVRLIPHYYAIDVSSRPGLIYPLEDEEVEEQSRRDQRDHRRMMERSLSGLPRGYRPPPISVGSSVERYRQQMTLPANQRQLLPPWPRLDPSL